METPRRTMRIPDHEWKAWKTHAKKLGKTLTGWIREIAQKAVEKRCESAN